MFGLVLLYFAGKAFYDLAGIHKKGQWLYAILGVVSYYAGLFLGTFLIALIWELFLAGSIDDLNDMLLSLLALPIGILTCWGFYRYLKSRWEDDQNTTTSPEAPSDILDGNFINRDPNTP